MLRERAGTVRSHSDTTLILLVAIVLIGAWFGRSLPVVDEVLRSGYWTWHFIFTSERVWVVIGGTVALELMFPARREERLLNVGLAQDVFYFLVNTPVAVALTVTVIAFVNTLLASRLDFLVLKSVANLPWVAVFLLSFLVGDFLAWFHHYVRHKIPYFWRFHAIHHSQREINLFTDGRNHPLDVLIAQLLIVVPFFIFGAHIKEGVEQVATFSFVLTWYPRFYHANVRTNLGPLRYLLVTPQSHRIHHSIQPDHADRNFGVILSVWDRLFGMQHPSVDEYPATGIPDADFPHETSFSPLGILRCYATQFFCPFRRSVRLAPPTEWSSVTSSPG